MEYLSRERLLVVTKEMVDERYAEVTDGDELSSIMDNYPSTDGEIDRVPGASLNLPTL